MLCNSLTLRHLITCCFGPASIGAMCVIEALGNDITATLHKSIAGPLGRTNGRSVEDKMTHISDVINMGVGMVDPSWFHCGF